jgi:hypothetical protein
MPWDSLSASEIASFHEKGYITIRNLLSPDEVCAAQAKFDSLMDGTIPIPGKDSGEHTPGLLNVTAFSLYHAMSTLGVFATVDARCKRVVEQLYPEGGMERDYEQLLRKLGDRPTAQFPPHQDMHYWPKRARASTRPWDTRTATCSIAVNEASEANGCLWVLPGSHAAKDLYPGCLGKLEDSRPIAGGVIKLEVLPEDMPRRVFLPLAAGDMTVHEEWVSGVFCPPHPRFSNSPLFSHLVVLALPLAPPRRHFAHLIDCPRKRRQQGNADARHPHYGLQSKQHDCH